MGNVAHNISAILPQQTFDTSTPRSVLGHILQEGPDDVSTAGTSGSKNPSSQRVGWIMRRGWLGGRQPQKKNY